MRLNRQSDPLANMGVDAHQAFFLVFLIQTQHRILVFSGHMCMLWPRKGDLQGGGLAATGDSRPSFLILCRMLTE